jgi:cellobiose phosphorylase
MVAGRDAAKPGEGKNSWLTGTAAWMWLTVSQYILGIQPAYNGLVINPCLPVSMKGYTVTRRFRDAEYVICVENPDGKQCGVKSITLDGAPIEGNSIPYSTGKHQVKVVM